MWQRRGVTRVAVVGLGLAMLLAAPALASSPPLDLWPYRAVTHDWYDVKLGWGGIVLQQHSMPQHGREGNPGLGCAAYLIYGSRWNKPAGSRLFRGKSPTQNNG
jgi:hypothetical protein